MKLLLIVGTAVATLGLFLLATASADTTLLARHYPLLLGVNAALAALLAALVAYQLVALARRYRARVFGVRLTLRLLVRFAALAVVPGLIVYAVSVHFLTRSIESWFDVKVDAALEGGINLGQQVIDQMMTELQAKARAMALELAERAPAQPAALLERLREQAGIREAVLVTSGGRVVASAAVDVSTLLPDLPGAQALRQARANRGYSSVDAQAGGPLSLRVVVPVEPRAFSEEMRFLQVRQNVSASIAKSADAVEAAYRDYRQLAISREGLKRIYVVTLTFALLMALFVAVGVALTQSNLLSEPLANLAQATQALARGDFSGQTPVTSHDELGVLIESFNSMTRQLDEARGLGESRRVALETAKAHLESILANLSAGVMVFDRGFEVTISNRGAGAILGAEAQAFAERMRAQFRSQGAAAWQLEIALVGTGKTLLARGAGLPGATGGGYVLVFDDITQLMAAQRATAWAEVARRLAHEIKNPLTPIQLSAERLERKLAGRLASEEAETLRRSIETIVNQVTALKSMVDDFRDYAKLPAPVLVRLDLNRLVGEVLSLYENPNVPIRRRLAPGLPPIRADSAQIRQVIHNLVQNAQDALENRKDRDAAPAIEVGTELDGDRVRLSVSDNGSGFPAELMAHIFEPYVTTKPRGTGLGLAIVKKIVDEHHGSIAIENLPRSGASVSVLLPLEKAA
ncbi:MAG: PAS domain-containing sensor histidine kinase [Betaproteobacteria bacterium RIFCSPHIGHO2_12_FULL_69_13]|nr:MAG: PAS domain-containing sensor histidine kinase [Betaproteobacteria bacterium RIFCSPHIGHO2_12_FULL_69_13]OGA65232.1 MAG: PAS domain-containing sensor histidine kinase [Betaproteobacteria bacterium RIFCSPLOWO2_12_FULL_68_20]